ncbi:hypothetical protein H710_00379 [Bartonella bacilliformis Ver097]|uniref:Uncharacterized protein n=2 Tax=Bartonella bacilliformis TaxID=774 RepID=A0A072RIQ8_BARBA|nr:DUF1376 domain-containing protein [Bartonella bacilliformis]KEG21429.1 hypothetical protein H710_00379 [Bartonella bacilliformis Ver097]
MYKTSSRDTAHQQALCTATLSSTPVPSSGLFFSETVAAVSLAPSSAPATASPAPASAPLLAASPVATTSSAIEETPHYESSILPYVCWYQNDFLGGVRGMRAHEIGIYTILLNEMYARGHPLDLSTQRLTRLCGCDKRTFLNALNILIAEGKIIPLANGLWNKRCDSIFRERAKLLKQKSLAGRSSAQKRKKINATPQQLLNTCRTDETYNSEAQKKEKETPNGVSQKQQNKASFSADNSSSYALYCAPSCSSPSWSSAPSQEPIPTTSTAVIGPTLATTSTPITSSPSVISPPFLKSPIISENSALPPKHSARKGCLKGHRLPADWQADISMAMTEGLSEEQARWQEKKFRDYWRAKSGKEALKVDWPATWRNWCRYEIERLKETQDTCYPTPSLLRVPSHQTNRHTGEERFYQSLINYPNQKP